ncbi:MAG: PqqD family protein, partial [Gammaproteobacteria bacterium]|nr:PqqD family protein [Gammaproteobacteria bacterium]
QRNCSVQDIVQAMVAAFEVDSEKAAADVTAVLGNFRDLGLIQST